MRVGSGDVHDPALDVLAGRGPVVMFRLEPASRRLHYVTPNAPDVIGVPASELLGPSGLDPHLHIGDRARWRRDLEGLVEISESEGQYRIVRGDGTEIWVEIVVRLDRSGGVVFGYAHDITDKMAILAELRGAHAEVKAANEELIRARDAAERANLAKSEFLSGMSHELRTPLNSILGFAQLLDYSNLTADDRDNVREILKGGRHLIALVDEVLDIARIEAGRISLSIEPVAVGEVVDECIALMGPIAEQKSVAIDVVGDLGEDVFMLADRQRIKQVMLNLLSNAIKYNRPSGKVTLSVARREDKLQLEVADTGIGIPGGKLADVFKPFDRLGIEQSGIEGTGLGLTLSKRLVEAMGGRLDVRSEPGVGSTFTVMVPGAVRPRLAGIVHLDKEAADRGGGLPERTVVCIEDNLSNLKLVEHVLERRPAITVHGALQARLGLELISQLRPDLVLLDLNLPDADGAEVLAHLRGDPATARLPVVVISADATPGRIDQLLGLGANAYLTKPLDVARLLLTVDELLSKGEAGGAGSVRA